jgi:AraC family transcriptional regulator of adaptative response / DNA-3-methyladenine glycosylase II
MVRKYYQLPLKSALDWEPLLAYLKLRAIPGVEVVDDRSYRRSFVWDHTCGYFTVAPTARGKSLKLKVICQAPAHLKKITRRVGRIFDLDAPVNAIRNHLCRDPLLAGALQHTREPRVPGTWSGFELAVRAIIGQQIAVKSATTVAGRLVQKFGRPLPDNLADEIGGLTHLFPAPETLAGASVSQMGMPQARAKTIRTLAEQVQADKIRLDPASDPHRTIRLLKRIKGIGDWTAQYVAMRALRQPDAFPASDLGLLKAASGNGQRISPAQLRLRAEPWRPYRAYAAVLLWTAATEMR